MLINIGTIVGYNNEIIISKPDQQLGLNSGLIDSQSDITSPEYTTDKHSQTEDKTDTLSRTEEGKSTTRK